MHDGLDCPMSGWLTLHHRGLETSACNVTDKATVTQEPRHCYLKDICHMFPLRCEIVLLNSPQQITEHAGEQEEGEGKSKLPLGLRGESAW